jgi:UDP-N-acetylglucosamine--dolichyl-phosphate N-acetylglucosaminephosphotransferase
VEVAEKMIQYIITFLFVLCAMPIWISWAKTNNHVGRDKNKFGQPKVAESGGIVVSIGFILGLFFNVSWDVFALFLVFVGATIMGYIDDKISLKQRHKPMITLFLSIPMVILCWNQGIFYALVLVPIGIVGASNAFNMLAGYNGLEAGMGVLILLTLGGFSFLNGYPNISAIAFIMVAALLAFLRYNWFPARVFPGDALTYSVGALIGCISILAHLEFVGVALFLLYFVDFVLPLRAGLKANAFGIPTSRGVLLKPYNKIYDTTHWAIGVLGPRATESNVVKLILFIQLIICVVVFCLMLL